MSSTECISNWYCSYDKTPDKGNLQREFFFALWLWLTIGGTSHYALKVIVVRTQSNWSDCVCSQEAERGYCCYSAYCLLLWVRGSSTWSNVYQCRVFLPMQLPQSSYLSLVDAQRYIQMLVDWAIPADNQRSSSHWDDKCMVQDWLNSKAKLLLLLSFPLNQFPYIAQDIAFFPRDCKIRHQLLFFHFLKPKPTTSA